jgi:hypothetical protein
LRLIYFVLFTILLGCQSKTEPSKDVPEPQGRKSSGYVEALMSHYRAPETEIKGQLPPPPIGYAYFTVGATDEEDTVRILLDTVKELIDLSILAKQPADSITIASLVRGESLLKLNPEAKQKASLIKHRASLDSIIQKGKKFTLDSLFTKSGMQKDNLEPQTQAYLIDALSNWGLLVYWDDYGGYYTVKEAKE